MIGYVLPALSNGSQKRALPAILEPVYLIQVAQLLVVKPACTLDVNRGGRARLSKFEPAIGVFSAHVNSPLFSVAGLVTGLLALPLRLHYSSIIGACQAGQGKFYYFFAF